MTEYQLIQIYIIAYLTFYTFVATKARTSLFWSAFINPFRWTRT